MRQQLKTISMATREFTPDSHKDYNIHAEKMIDRPMLFVVRPMSRDELFEFQDLIEVKVDDDETQIKGLGKATKYIWKRCVQEAKNVVTDKGEFASVKGKQKDDLIDTTGMEIEVLEVTAYIRKISSLETEEVKN